MFNVKKNVLEYSRTHGEYEEELRHLSQYLPSP